MKRRKEIFLVECSPVLGPGINWVTGQDRKLKLTDDQNEARIFSELEAYQVALYVRELGYRVRIQESS